MHYVSSRRIDDLAPTACLHTQYRDILIVLLFYSLFFLLFFSEKRIFFCTGFSKVLRTMRGIGRIKGFDVCGWRVRRRFKTIVKHEKNFSNRRLSLTVSNDASATIFIICPIPKTGQHLHLSRLAEQLAEIRRNILECI